jgi:D-alanyl-D-alanine carboxypeptidase
MAVVMGPDGGVAHAAVGADSAVLDEDTPIRIASITKVCTALVVLELVDEGRVDLDAPAAGYVSRVAVPDEMTVRDLLQHTSGIPEFTEDADLLDSWFTDSDRVWNP